MPLEVVLGTAPEGAGSPWLAPTIVATDPPADPEPEPDAQQ